MNVHILQHVPFEGIGSMAEWLKEQQACLSWTRFSDDPALPDISGLDLVIAMGGPMSVNDEAEFPWLQAEKRFLRTVIERGVPVVGICLGAQLIASALGAPVYPNRVKEIGWYPVHAVPANDAVFHFPDSVEVLHWHGETFELPPGATLLAGSAACRNQAFQLGSTVIGLQFHLETTQGSLAELIDHSRGELTEAPFIQSEPAMRSLPPETFARCNRLMIEILEYLTGI